MEEEQFQERQDRGGQEPSGEHVSQEGVERLRAMLGSRPVAMLTTLDPGGALRSRPMAVQEISDQGELFLITQRTSQKVEEVSHEQHVNLSFLRALRGRYVSVSGRATVMRDDAKLRQLWHPTLHAWFPDGLDDPDLCLLCVRIDKAESWNAPAGNLAQVARLAGSILGRSPKPTHDEGRDTVVIRIRQPGIGDTAGILGAAGGNVGVAPRVPQGDGKARVVGTAGGTMGEAPTSGAPRGGPSQEGRSTKATSRGASAEQGKVAPPTRARGEVAEAKAVTGDLKRHAQVKPDQPVAQGEAAPRRGGRGR
ncbi:MAG: pyridoxamine 5'-phosphate oxidase family protein [Pseudomonadota bacterium]|nr:pyridoxamine 5'-phosphate oxidase family protein [Pseudomonadota bacterium]